MSKLIDKLTKEQEAKIPEYLDKYYKIATCTDPCPRSDAEKAVRAAYKHTKNKEPSYFIWVDNPNKGARIAAVLARASSAKLTEPEVRTLIETDVLTTVTESELTAQRSKATYGSFEALWFSFYAFIAFELPVVKDKLIDIVYDIVNTCGIYWTFEDVVVMCDRPLELHLSNNKVHNDKGPAMVYRDGAKVISHKGVRYNNLMELAIKTKMENNE